MTEEEKKAIEKIRSFNQYNWEMNNLKEKKFAKPYFDALDTIFNLIEKQQKEIEEYKNRINKAIEYINHNIFYVEENEYGKDCYELGYSFDKKELLEILREDKQ